MGFFSFFAPKKKQQVQKPERLSPSRKLSHINRGVVSKSADSQTNDILNPLNPISPFSVWNESGSNSTPEVSSNDFSGFGGGDSGGAGASGDWGISSDSSSSYDSGSGYDSGSSSCDSSSSSSDY